MMSMRTFMSRYFPHTKVHGWQYAFFDNFMAREAREAVLRAACRIVQDQVIAPDQDLRNRPCVASHQLDAIKVLHDAVKELLDNEEGRVTRSRELHYGAGSPTAVKGSDGRYSWHYAEAPHLDSDGPEEATS